MMSQLPVYKESRLRSCRAESVELCVVFLVFRCVLPSGGETSQATQELCELKAPTDSRIHKVMWEPGLTSGEASTKVSASQSCVSFIA